MYAGQPPWHGINDNKVLIKQACDAREALRLGGLDWEVQRRSVFVDSGDWPKSNDDYIALVRSDTERVLAIHKGTYEELQNTELALLAEATTALSSEVMVDAAFELFGGRVVVMVLQTGEASVLTGDETILPYLMLSTSHDGSHAMGARNLNFRPECMNGFAWAVAGTQSEITVKHTRNAQNYLAEARRVLALHYDHQERLMAEIEDMLREPCNYEPVVDALVGDRPVPEPGKQEGRSQTEWDKRRAGLFRAYNRADLNNVRHSAWGAVMAVNSYELWEQGFKGDDRAVSQAKRLLTNGGYPLTSKARSLVRV
jgi:phage/plasmid-like protein (TIGR03299 family)